MWSVVVNISFATTTLSRELNMFAMFITWEPRLYKLYQLFLFVCSQFVHTSRCQGVVYKAPDTDELGVVDDLLPRFSTEYSKIIIISDFKKYILEKTARTSNFRIIKHKNSMEILNSICATHFPYIFICTELKYKASQRTTWYLCPISATNAPKLKRFLNNVNINREWQLID